LLCSQPTEALNLAAVKDAADARIDLFWSLLKSAGKTCVRKSNGLGEQCFTNWSCTKPCNNKNADASVCLNAQVDQGISYPV
jgi:hypothetical protein